MHVHMDVSDSITRPCVIKGDAEEVQKQWLPRVQYFGYKTIAELRY